MKEKNETQEQASAETNTSTAEAKPKKTKTAKPGNGNGNGGDKQEKVPLISEAQKSAVLLVRIYIHIEQIIKLTVLVSLSYIKLIAFLPK